MLRHFLANSICSSARAAWLCAALMLLAGCTQRSETPWSAAVEQTTDIASTDAVDAPLQQRRLHLSELGIERWHQSGRRGQGVKIAILDSGFRGYEKFLANGLPARVKTRSFRKDRNLEARDSQHGIFCGEVLHAIAPEAELLLANWEPDSPDAFLDAVRWAKAEGARIVSCSLIMPGWSDGEGGGEVHRQLHEALGDGRSARDLLCFASAGNIAERHWCGKFAPDEDRWHRWHPEATDNALTPWGDERVAVEFYGPTQSAYEILVYHRSGKLVGKSASHQDATKKCSRAAVRFEPDPDASYSVRVRCLQEHPTEAEAFHLVVLGGSLKHTTTRGSVAFPGDGASVMAVGAVDAQKRRVSYSSCGPNSRLPKPDFVATVPFPILCRAQPFAGTSAAAPQAAGLAALLWSRNPDRTPSQVIQALREAALDLGPPGHDFDTGYGLVRMPRP
jgi:Subtilase family